MTTGSLRSVLSRLSAVCLIAVVALAATPSVSAAMAKIRSINGIDSGERVSGDVFVWARSTGDVSEVRYKLTGPAEFEVTRSGHFSYFMLNDEGKAVSWDTTTVPDGQYKLTVYSLHKGEVYRSKEIRFAVDNISPEAEAALAAAKQAAEQEEAEASAREEAAAQEAAASEEAAVASRVEESGSVQADDQAPQDKQVEDPAAAPSPALDTPEPAQSRIAEFSIGFVEKGGTYRQGSGQAVALSATGLLNANQDVLVLAWSHAESRVVDAFAFPLTAAPWQIPASRMDMLPAGRVDLQLLVRQDGKKTRKIMRTLKVLAPLVPFKVGFANAPAEYQLGSGSVITLSPAGDLGDGEDVLVQAWSDAANALVDGFAFSLSAGPWEIPANRLDLLPQGSVELQLIKRGAAEKTKVTHRMTVSAPAPVVPDVTLGGADRFEMGQAGLVSVQLSSALPEGHELVAMAKSAQDQQALAGFEHTLNSVEPRIDAARLNQLPAGSFDLVVQVRDGAAVLKQASLSVQVDEPVVAEPAPEPVGSTEPSAQFVDRPAAYVVGSGVAIDFAVENLPAGGDVLIIAWSDALGGLVDGFGHSPDAAPWRISAAKLDQLPAGSVELQLIVRGGDTRPKTVHRLQVVRQTADGGTTNPAPVDEPASDPTAGDPTDPGTGSPSDPATDPGTVPAPEPVDTPADTPTTGPGGDPVDDNDPGFTGPAEGFTELTKTPDTRVIYVSSSQGNDANNGLSEARPVKTLKKAASLMTRWGKPDWMLLKAGDVWEGETFELNCSGGGAGKEDFVGVYGEGPRPVIIPAAGAHGIKLTSNQIDGLVIQGLHIYAATRDPGSDKYVSRGDSVDGINLRLSSSDGQYARNFVIEDCKVTHFDTNMEIVDDWPRIHAKEGDPGRIEVNIRRNIVMYASGSDSHSVGIYLEGLRDSVVEQNLLDHNGWAQTDGMSHRNKRSHNIYAQSFNGPIAIRHNIITRGAANGLQLRAGGDVEHNLFVRNALAFWVSINNSKANYNVILECDDMDPNDPDKARGIGIQGWSMDYYEVIGNVVARRVGGLQRPALELHAGTLVVKNNRIYEFMDPNKQQSMQLNSGDLTNTGNLSIEAFGGKEPPFVDPERGVEEYAKKIGLDASLEAFVAAASKRPRGQWVDEYDPATVCRYIRNGFDLIPHD